MLTENRKYKLAILNSHPTQYFAPLYRRIAREERIDLTVYYCNRKGLDEYSDKGFGQKLSWDIDLTTGYKHIFLRNLRRSATGAGFASLINPEIVRELHHEKFDALWIHGHNYLTYQIAMVAGRLYGISLLMRCETHLRLQRSLLKRIVRRPLLNLLYRNFAGCLAIGSRNAEFYRYHGVPARKIQLVPYTVDNEHFIERVAECRTKRDMIRSDFRIPPDIPVILYASKLTPRKNPMHLLKAFHQLQESGVAAELVFVGSGSEEDSLKAYAAQYNLKSVTFHGFKNQSELPSYYALANIFVLPSRNEPWGLIINEAMCAALPIIASEEIGAVSDLVKHGKNGFTFPAGDVDTLTSHLEKLCLDADLRMRMGAASLELIRHWSYEEAVAGIMVALESLDGEFA